MFNRFAGDDVQGSTEVEQCFKSLVIYEIFGQVNAAIFGSFGLNQRALRGAPHLESLDLTIMSKYKEAYKQMVNQTLQLFCGF